MAETPTAVGPTSGDEELVARESQGRDTRRIDVRDAARFHAFVEKRAVWLGWLHGDGPHSISNQVVTMLVEDQTFRAINEARKLFDAGRGGCAGFNTLVMHLVESGYVARQSLAIRRLVEPEQKKRERQVISLRRLLDDMRKSCELLVRENYVCCDGAPYDYLPGQAAALALNPPRPPKYVTAGLADPLGSGWCSSFSRHSHFDDISGVRPSSRERADRMSPVVFDIIDAALSEAKVGDIEEYANKFVAHAADDHSIATLDDEQRSLTLDKIQRIHETLARVVNFVSGAVLMGPAQSFLPTTIYDPIVNFDRPWVDPKNMAEVRGAWRKREHALEDW